MRRDWLTHFKVNFTVFNVVEDSKDFWTNTPLCLQKENRMPEKCYCSTAVHDKATPRFLSLDLFHSY